MYNFLKENYLEYDYNSITMPLFYHSIVKSRIIGKN